MKYNRNGSYQTSLIKYEAVIVYYSLLSAVTKISCISLQKMASFCIATRDDPAETVPSAMDFHYRFVQLWNLPLNHGPKVLL